MEIIEGSIVRSIAGRDKGERFIVLVREGDYAYLADGDLRKVERPKKKKLKHLQGSYAVSEVIKDKLHADEEITNSQVRKALAEFD